ncbi:MAG: CBASS cGAMP-activated phospholipase [Bacteroidota bacterium]
MGKPFKILSIDGGGIKGLYSSTILEHLEAEFECRISDHFDLLCGTSTGGLIALGLSQKISAEDISDIYKEKGDEIFPSRSPWMRWFEWIEEKYFGGKFFPGQTFWFGKYNNENLKAILESMFGGKRVKDTNNLLCIPTYSVTDGRPWVFKYDHKEGNLSRDNEALYVDVALATSAAPTYLPIHEISFYNNKQFVDGGVWANNPTLVGVIEAIRYFVGPGKEYDSLQVLSISSLSNAKGKPTGWRKKRSFIGWRGDLFDVSMNGQSMFTDYIMSSLAITDTIPIEYYRIPSADISHEQVQLVDMDATSKKCIDLLCGKGNDMGTLYRKKDEIKSFFASHKTYQI